MALEDDPKSRHCTGHCLCPLMVSWKYCDYDSIYCPLQQHHHKYIVEVVIIMRVDGSDIVAECHRFLSLHGPRYDNG